LLLLLAACNEAEHPHVGQKEVVQKPEDINARAEELIQGTLKDMLSNSNALPDSLRLKKPALVSFLYDKNSFQPLWTSKGSFISKGDSLITLIEKARQFGMLPDDYYFTRLKALKLQLADTSKEKKLDASLWAYSDLLLSSAFVQFTSDLKAGRLLPDSVLEKDTLVTPDYFLTQFRDFGTITNDSFTRRLEPLNTDYQRLKTALGEFLEKAKFKDYTFISTRDSTKIPALLYKRLAEEDSTMKPVPAPDSLTLSEAIRKYQKRKEIRVDGKNTKTLVERLNATDKEKFFRIAVTLDRYKMLPILPEQYIWVNLPSYYLQLRQADTLVMKSRVVVGKPLTRTPIITSSISDMITYPQWTIPESIIKKEILPGLKRDPGYTSKRGYSLIDKDGNEVDPYSVKWAKYENAIPYKVVQGSGDANALGVLKFNFPNKHSVYLHDTNQRYLFSQTSRALSHGCVRVQAWQELAQFILRNDSTYSENAVPVDSMESWLQQKQRHYIPVRKPVPLFIRYFTCDVNESGKLVFYEDIYGEDKKYRDKIFANK
jgi:murein L,D-transpeptidase YcbB/YkuD